MADPQIKATFTETAYYALATGTSNAGDDTYGSAVSFLCRTEIDRWKHGPIFIPRHGEDLETAIRLFTETDVPDRAIVWLPGVDETDVTLARKVRRREVARRETGVVSHYELYL